MNYFYFRTVGRILRIAGCVLLAHTAIAQSPKELNTKDTADINAAAKSSLEHFRSLLVILCDANISSSDKDKGIENAFVQPLQIFLNNQIKIENDIDSSQIQNGGLDLLVEAETYLKNFKLFFHPDEGGSAGSGEIRDPVVFNIDDISRVKLRNGNLFLRVRYNQVLNGKNQNGSPLGKSERVALYNVVKIGAEWRVSISRITFDKVSGSNDNNLNVPVVAGNAVAQASGTRMRKDYPKILLKGTEAANLGHFSEAYRYFSEAHESNTLRATADEKIEDLKSSMHASGITNYNDNWFGGLKVSGDALNKKHKYEEAKKYYTYAYGLHPIDAELQNKLESIDIKIAAKEKLDGLYNNKAYDQALAGYTDELERDPGNSDLYVGIAKCYGATGNNAEALDNFGKAILYDSTNAGAYMELAEFHHDRKNYDEAYKNYAIYVRVAEFQNDNMISKLKEYKSDCEKYKLRSELDNSKDKGSVLNATNVWVEAVKHKGKKYKGKKVRKANAIRVHFDIEKNLLAETGQKDVYITIINPRGTILKDPNNSNTVTTSTGEEIQYSMTGTIPFVQNQPLKNNIFVYSWGERKKHKKGRYKAVVYGRSVTNVYKIGETGE